MVEAAIFFPIAVFCAMAVMALLLNIYSQTTTQAHINNRTRAEAASYDGKSLAVLTDAYGRDRYRLEAEAALFSVDESKSPKKSMQAAHSEYYYGGRFTNRGGYETEYYSRSYILDEAAIVRTKDSFLRILE